MLSAVVRPAALRGERYFAELRAREYARLDARGEAYLDFTGSALYGESQVRAHAALLEGALFGNPHSEHLPSRRSTAVIERARALTLDFLGADPLEYEVIFTTNASGALRLVAESFPFTDGSRLVLTADNHNSVNGIREYALGRGATVDYIPLDADLRLTDADDRLEAPQSGAPSLFAYPAQSNFSGVHHPLSLVRDARARGYFVLLDAAAYLPTCPLRLSGTSLSRGLDAGSELTDVAAPDFVTLSFYKMFGYPTGIGALVARRETLARLSRPWFAGGTIEFASVQNRTHMFKQGAEAFEDGTPNFLGLAALPEGFALLNDAGMPSVRRHVTRLTAMLLAELTELAHSDGQPMTRIHGPRGTDARGATVAFNVLDRDGRTVPYERVEARARAENVSVRGGCFCNPGAAEHAFGFPAAHAAACLERGRREGFSIPRFSECLHGLPVGAVRASIGIPSNEADVLRLIALLSAWCDKRVDEVDIAA